ncbi:l-threonine 3-dehydrogenase [Firmicutes bacterium CAG:552]|nr:l-threonine 3-dehydrogenase [Firmicutes bacterium CAG:552]
MKMDALVKKYPDVGLVLEQAEVPVIKEGEALVKIHKTAICGTDVHIYNWNQWAQQTIKTPMIIGHEFVGEIVEIKGNSPEFKVGDLVSAEGHVTCGHCRNCKEGLKHLCPTAQGIGVNRNGIFAEYAAIPLSNLWKCDKDIPEEMYAIFDPFGNATHTALAYPMIGEDVLITGAGPIGIMAAAICKHVGARHVVITNTSDWRLEFAKQVVPGVVTVNTKTTDLKDVQRSLGMTDGFGVGLEMSGNGNALNQMIDNMINGGKIALLGLGINGGIEWDKFIFKCLHLQGIYGRKVFETWRKMTTMLQSGLDISKIITHRLPYTEFKQGFDLMNSKKSGKIILDWTK